jgi:Wnt-binding factor required for Wnt secretion/Lipase (class 3)
MYSTHGHITEKLITTTDSEGRSSEGAGGGVAETGAPLHPKGFYGANRPQILLEVLSARTLILVIALTYLSFLGCFFLDYYSISYDGSNTQFDLTTADSSFSGPSWQAYVNPTPITNFVSVQLNVAQTNVTLQEGESISVTFDLGLYACYQSDGISGCGAFTSGASSDGSLSSATAWHQVVSETNQIWTSTTTDKDVIQETITAGLLPNTFQNQESIPTKGIVKSYYMYVNYTSVVSTSTTNCTLFTQPVDEITYQFILLSRPSQRIRDSLTVVLMFFTILVLCAYIRVLYQYRKGSKWLSEQRWLILYIVAVILYQNPMYIIAVFSPTSNAGLAFASYFVDQLSQSLFFIIWLAFADSIHRKTTSIFWFYAPKILFGLAIFVVGLTQIIYQFPTLSPINKRNPVEAVSNWSEATQQTFCVFSIAYIFILWLWTGTWCATLYFSQRTLSRLPYMSTRYLQLSHRYFIVLAVAITFYYMFQYGWILYLIAERQTSSNSVTSYTNNINTLIREQTQLFGKVLFLSVYAFLLCFLFLPASFMETNLFSSALTASYVISEEELKVERKWKKSAIKQLRNNLLTNNLAMNQFVDTKVDVFCVDIALNLRTISFQAYYDPIGITTASRFPGEMRLEDDGYTLIDLHYNSDYEIFCFVARDIKSRSLVVSFRGSSSKKHMEVNLDYSQRELDLFSMKMSALDSIDGLNVSEESIREMTIDREDSDDDDDDDYDNDADDDRSRGQDDGSTDADHGGQFSIRHTGAGQETSLRKSLANNSRRINKGVTSIAHTVVGATNTVVGTTTGILGSAVASAPGLKAIVRPHVHSGFWHGYEAVRLFVHAILRRELIKEPSKVYFTGHSLGGALTTFAAMDVSIHTLPRVNAYLKQKALEALSRQFSDEGRETRTKSSPRGFFDALSLPNQVTAGSNVKGFHKIRATMYNFGCPRVGNRSFAAAYNRLVPDSFRVVVDGDLVGKQRIRIKTYCVHARPCACECGGAYLSICLCIYSLMRAFIAGLPPSKYKHIGTQILIDSIGAGSIIVDPSIVERWLRTQSKTNLSVHSLLVYRKGLLGIKDSAEYFKRYAKEEPDVDIIKLAVHAHMKDFSKSKSDRAPLISDSNSSPASEDRDRSVATDEENKLDDEEARHLALENQLVESYLVLPPRRHKFMGMDMS